MRACVISARKAKHLDATTMFTYSHANTPLGQSERAYYLSYFIKYNIDHVTRAFIQYMIKYITVCGDLYNQKFYSEAVAMMHLKGPSKSQAFVNHYLKEHKKQAMQSRESPHKG